MFLWISMYIKDDTCIIAFISDYFSAKSFLEQAACSLMNFIDGFGIGIEYIAKSLLKYFCFNIFFCI